MRAVLQPSILKGSILVPPSKSMAHRLLICAALAKGKSHIHNLEFSADIQASVGALRLLGADIDCGSDEAVVVGTACGHSATPLSDSRNFRAEAHPVGCNESGSTLRLLIPIFALTAGPISFVGAPRLMDRPLTEYKAIFEKQGLFFGFDDGRLLIGGPLRASDFKLRGNVSSQFISGLLLALPLMDADSTITIIPPFESQGYVALTRRAQEYFGVTTAWIDEYTLLVPGRQHYEARDALVEGDWSQGAVPAVIAAVSGGDIDICGLTSDTSQGDRVILDVLRACGAEPSIHHNILRVTPPLNGLYAPGEVDLANCPDLGPILCTLAAFCEGATRIVNAGRLRIKESDRIEATQAELKKLGVHIRSTEDTITIEGGYPLQSSEVLKAHNDHRVLMAEATAALCAGIGATLYDAEAVSKSWPSFFNALQGLGAKVTLE